ncbi:MAG: carbon-nitrogen hydrolase family protein [Chloroflexi bacterium]|nr:MAG: carbon-nitrogen hydrolase family protein [Chloroflexota bacterium]
MREVTVAVVQMQPHLADVQTNLERMSDFVEQICLRHKTDLIVFPELITTGYECGVKFTELAERDSGPIVNFISQRAAEFSTHIVFGMALKERVESILYDAAILVGPDGEFIGDYRKVHLQDEERLAFRPGYRYRVLECSFGNIGVILGWDLAFPETARSLALDGAEILCVLANWKSPHVDEWRTYLLARAYENSIFVAAANRVGEEYTYSFFGQSMIVGPRGEIHALVDEPDEGYGVARIDLDQIRAAREEFQLIQAREPATYRAVVRKY